MDREEFRSLMRANTLIDQDLAEESQQLHREAVEMGFVPPTRRGYDLAPQLKGFWPPASVNLRLDGSSLQIPSSRTLLEPSTRR